jgi:nicotinamide-nucleotide amidase
MHAELRSLAGDVLKRAKDANLAVVTAESCTAGLMCQLLADAEGASRYFAGGFVTYTKEQKAAVLKVPPRLLSRETAVSCDVARAMAEGALALSAAGAAVAITGVAGPEPDEDGNPVGRVCIATAQTNGPTRAWEFAYGSLDRQAIRERAATDALKALIDAIDSVSAAA